MQDILASSPIMSTIANRHQAASTPINTDDNKFTNKHLKQENAFYENQIDSNVAVTGTNEPLENENPNSAATAMAFHYRNNFSVSNLANLNTESTHLLSSQQQQPQQNLGAWCYPLPLENSYNYNRSNFKSFHQSYQPFTDVNYPYSNAYSQQATAEMTYNQLPTILQSPLNTYNEVTSSNNLSPIDSKKTEHKTIPAYASSSSSPTLIKHELANAYPSYNQLSSSQISSSSFNTSHSSNKSVSPKANEFLNLHYQSQSFASGQLQTKPAHQSNSSGSSLSSPHSSIGTSIANLSSSSGAFSNANQIVVNTVSSASSSSVSSSSSSGLPANSTESFDWMKPVKSQPNGKTRTKDKYRVVYTEPQRIELEKEFLYSKYITIKRKSELSQTLSLSERQIKIWFQNRRAKDRKTSRKQRMDNNNNNVTSTTRNLGDLLGMPSTGFSDETNEDEEDDSDNDDISVDEEEDEPNMVAKTSKKSRARQQQSKAKSNRKAVNNSAEESVEASAYQANTFNPYVQQSLTKPHQITSLLVNNSANFVPATSEPAGSTFASYNQINSTPAYNQYFSNESQQHISNNYFGQTNGYSGYASFGNQSNAQLGQGLDYNTFINNQYGQHPTEHQYQYYQHQLLNGGSV